MAPQVLLHLHQIHRHRPKLLLLTALPLDAGALSEQMAERREAGRLKSRRPSFAALARQPGAEREGVVIRLEAYGAVVNVGARRPARRTFRCPLRARPNWAVGARRAR